MKAEALSCYPNGIGTTYDLVLARVRFIYKHCSLSIGDIMCVTMLCEWLGKVLPVLARRVVVTN